LRICREGTPRISKRGKNVYLYLEYRDGKNIINKYIGQQNSLKAKSIMEKVAQRVRYEKLLKETKSALKDVRKVLRRSVIHASGFVHGRKTGIM
jgi:hypothetical protein